MIKARSRWTILASASVAAGALALAGCDTSPPAEQNTEQAGGKSARPTQQDAFFAALASHCAPDGEQKAFAGKLVSSDEADDDFAGKAMVMQVRECSEDRIAVPFHVETAPGEWDRSRTWLITRTENGLRLKHDHRHQDGKPDPVTMYGGDTAADDQGTARVQNFPVDAESIALFEASDLSASVTNIWTVEIDPAGSDNPEPRFAYQLRRTKAAGAPEDRMFRVEFDLSEEVEAPPAPWGWE